jgi:hypothetical protein
MARFSTELLAQAGMLARREPRRPKQASLRRSISASYYALFHFLIEEATRMAVGTAHNRSMLRQFAGRAFVHGKMKAVCDEFTKATPKSDALRPFWHRLAVHGNADAQTVAENFIDLQESRHDADYNLSRHFTRQDASTAADKAKDAVEAWNRLKAANEELALLFALSLMLWPGLSGR